jgi:CSLREA domain-containing protein
VKVSEYSQVLKKCGINFKVFTHCVSNHLTFFRRRFEKTLEHNIWIDTDLCITQSIFGATFTVTKTDDTNDGTCDADFSLRETIIAANAATDADMIELDNND